MRSVLVTASLALAGCNWAFGLDATTAEPVPDGPPDGPPIPSTYARFSMQVAETNPMTGSPSTSLVYTAFDPAPDVKVGLVDGPLAPTTYADGMIELPGEFTGAKFRLEYVLPGGVPTEVHWTPPANMGFLVVPVFGRLTRATAPSQSKYQITPRTMGGSTHAFTLGRVFTTGFWSDTFFGMQTNGVVTIDATTMKPSSGPSGVPEPSKNDIVAVIDYASGMSCMFASGSAELTAPALQPGPAPTIAPDPLWNLTTPLIPTFRYEVGIAATSILQRVKTAVDTRHNDLTADARVTFGRFPSPLMPAFTQGVDGVTLPQPLLIPQIDCPITPGPTNEQTPNVSFDDPSALVEFPAVVHAAAFSWRSVLIGSARMASGIMVVNTENPTVTDQYFADFRTPMAIAPITLGTTDLAGAPESKPIAATGRVDLSFTFESTSGFVHDYTEIVLYRQVGSLGSQTLVPQRVYVLSDSNDRKVPIDFDALALPPAEYVFAIKAIRGRPKANVGDFSSVTFPQAVSTVFTRTFIVN